MSNNKFEEEKRKLTPETGFNLVGIDYFGDTENQLYLIEHFEMYQNALNAKNSGTTARLLTGLLARQNFASELVGSTQLTKRPMGRIVNLLKDYGSNIESDNGFLPLSVQSKPEDIVNKSRTVILSRPLALNSFK